MANEDRDRRTRQRGVVGTPRPTALEPLEMPDDDAHLASHSRRGRRIAGPFPIDSDGGSVRTYRLSPSRTGASFKNIQYSVVVLSKSSDNAKVGLALEHGPDADLRIEHSTPIALTQLGGTYTIPCVLTGSTNVANQGQIGECYRPLLIAGSAGGQQGMVVAVYELQKTY